MSQRIRLSDASARGAYERTGGQDAAVHCAVMEARSILAAEEPADGMLTPAGSSVARLSGAAEILAASLAAFDTLTIEELRVIQVCPTATFNG